MVQFRLATSRALILLESLGSISLETVPLWELQFFSFLEVYSPLPGTQKKTIPHRPSSWLTSYTFSATAFLFVQEQNDEFSQLSFLTFSWVYWEKDNGCHNVVKTWTLNLKTKTKKKNNSLQCACLIEHFTRTLDRISVSLSYISKALYLFSYKNLSLFEAKLKKYFCPSFPENKIHSSAHHTHIRFKTYL